MVLGNQCSEVDTYMVCACGSVRPNAIYCARCLPSIARHTVSGVKSRVFAARLTILNIDVAPPIATISPAPQRLHKTMCFVPRNTVNTMRLEAANILPDDMCLFSQSGGSGSVSRTRRHSSSTSARVQGLHVWVFWNELQAHGRKCHRCIVQSSRARVTPV